MKLLVCAAVLLSALLYSFGLRAQDKKLIPLMRYPAKIKDTLTKARQDTADERDLNDALHFIFRKNYKPGKKDSIGRKPIISFVPAAGYSLQSETAVTFTGNIVFRSKHLTYCQK